MVTERIFLVAAMLFPTVMAWAYFIAAAPAGGDSHGPSAAMQALYAGGKVVQFALPVVCWLLIGRRPTQVLRPNWTGLRPALAFGIWAGVSIAAVYFTLLKGHPLLAGMPEQVRARITQLGLTTPARYGLFAGFLCVLHALLEEYYWRGFVFDGLRRWTTLSGAMVISSLAFMAHHVVVLHVYASGRFLTGTLPLALGVAFGGGVWAWIYHRSGSIYPSWLSHALVDAGIMIVGFEMAFSR